MKTPGTRKWFFNISLLLLVGLVLVVPRLKRLGQYVFVDETFYLKHSAQFYWAIANQEFDQTDLVIHPGVTTHWLGAAAFRQVFPEFARIRDEIGISDLKFRRILEANGLSLLTMLVWSRRMVVLFNSFVLLLAYLLMRRLFPAWLSALAILLVGLDPFLFELSRFLHVDGMLAILMFASLLAFMVYLKEHRWFWLVFSGGLAGLSILTKVTGIVLIAGVGLFALMDWFGKRENVFGRQRSWRGLLNLILILVAWLLIALAVVFLVWPAMWTDPLASLSRIFEFVIDQGNAEVISPNFFNGRQNSTGVFDLNYAYYYPLSYLWRASPVTLVGIGLLAVYYFFRNKWVQKDFSWDIASKLLVFALLYTVLMTISVKKFDRYILPVFPLLDVLAAAGFFAWVQLVVGSVSNRMDSQFLHQGVFALAVAVIAAYQGLMVYQAFPYGLSYYNPWMGGSEKASEVMLVGYGEGLDQAGAYMMTIPGKRDFQIYSFYSNVFGYSFMQQINELPWYPDQYTPDVFEADYWIVYHSQRQRGLSAPALEFVEGYEPEHTVVINGIEYAWIYNLAEIRGD